MIAIVPAKGLLGILGPFYNNSEGVKKEEESKQPVKSRSSPKLRHVILTPTPIILGTNDPQQIEDKGHEIHLPAPKETINLLLFIRLLIKQDKIYVMAQPIPALGTLKTLYFIG